MYLYHSDTQTTGPEEMERPRGNFPSNFLKISFTTKHDVGIFFLSVFFFTNLNDSQDSRGRGKVSF